MAGFTTRIRFATANWVTTGAGALAAATWLAAGAARGADCEPGLPHFAPQALVFPTGASFVTPDGKVRITGYNDMAGMLTAMSALFSTAHPEFTFDLVLKGTRTAPPALADGTSALAPMGAEFSAAEMKDYLARLGAAPLLVSVAHDSHNPAALSSPTGIYVHRDNPMNSITLEEARRVFAAIGTGQAVTWGDLGLAGDWEKRPVHIHGLGPQAAIGQFFAARVFKNSPFATSFIVHAQSKEVVAALEGDPDSIGFANLNHVKPGVRQLALRDPATGKSVLGTPEELRAGVYPLDRKLLIYARAGADGSAADPFAAEFLRLVLSCEGQQIIAEGSLGYIPLSPSEVTSQRNQLAR